MKRKFYLVFFVLCVSACVKLKPKNSDSESTDATNTNASAVARPSKVSYEIVDGSEAHQYQIKFSFREPVSSVFLIKTTGEKKDSQWVTVKDQAWTDTSFAPGEMMTYEFGYLNQQEFIKWDEISLRGPQDLILDKAVSLKDEKFKLLLSHSGGFFVLEKYYRIFLGPQARLTTNGQMLKLVAKEIHSEGGRIETFPAGAAAPVGERGRHGGQIEIQAETITGTLNFELRGENGGDGLEGKKPDERLKGKKGRNGVDATLQYEGTVFGESLPSSRYWCASQPTSGERGGKGAQGYRGGDGLPGGSAGRLILKVKNKSDFNFKVDEAPGLGGRGGSGGDGGEGGDGGIAGKLPTPGGFVTYLSCNSVSNGEKGEPGDIGPQGQSGPMGEPKRPCEKNDESICY